MTLKDPPGAGLDPKPVEWPKGKLIHRVHDATFAGASFNPCKGRPTRFAPIADARGACVPSLYGAESFDTAVFESVLRDITPKARVRRIYASHLKRLSYSVLAPVRKLVLVDLTVAGLHSVKVDLEELFGGAQRRYPKTARWAEAFFRQVPWAQGLRWMSKRNNTEQAVVLFGPRIPDGSLVPAADTLPMTHPLAYATVKRIATSVDVTVVEP